MSTWFSSSLFRVNTFPHFSLFSFAQIRSKNSQIHLYKWLFVRKCIFMCVRVTNQFFCAKSHPIFAVKNPFGCVWNIWLKKTRFCQNWFWKDNKIGREGMFLPWLSWFCLHSSVLVGVSTHTYLDRNVSGKTINLSLCLLFNQNLILFN